MYVLRFRGRISAVWTRAKDEGGGAEGSRRRGQRRAELTSSWNEEDVAGGGLGAPKIAGSSSRLQAQESWRRRLAAGRKSLAGWAGRAPLARKAGDRAPVAGEGRTLRRKSAQRTQ